MKKKKYKKAKKEIKELKKDIETLVFRPESLSAHLIRSVYQAQKRQKKYFFVGPSKNTPATGLGGRIQVY